MYVIFRRIVPPHVLLLPLFAVVFVPPLLIATSQYLAFDRLREGFRYWRAWQHFRSHLRAGLLVIGYALLGLLLYQLVHAALPLAGPARGAAGVALDVVSSLVQLIGAHLMGQYVALAYARERA